jgi:hypothetical protein
MNVCAACGASLRQDDLITARLGQTFHSRCVDHWEDDDPDDSLTPLSDGYPEDD